VSDPHAPSPEELAALEQLREADPAVLIVQAFEILGSGAVVKLGRPDARVLIDALATLTSATEGALPPQLVAQMRQDITRLQMGQVEAEREAAAAGQAPEAAAQQQPQPQGGQQQAGQQQAGQQQAGQPQPPGGQKLTDRLWIPGREPGPPRR
jgi:hypothetical protein